MSDLSSRLTRCFHAVFPSIPADQIPRASAATVEAWDSVNMVNLLAVVGEEFGVEIDWEKADELTSFEAIERMLAAGSSARPI